MKAIEVKNLVKEFPLPQSKKKGKKNGKKNNSNLINLDLIKENLKSESPDCDYIFNKDRYVLRGGNRYLKAVDSITFSVDSGEILGFIGPNGAGKSTTIKMLSGILTPSSGEISVLGFHPSKDRKKMAYKIATVFGQKSQLLMHLAPLDTFKLLGAIYSIDKKMLNDKISKFTTDFELENIINVPTRKLSLGERIKCEIVASLLHEPEVLFLDEPTIGLDIIIKKKIRELILKMNKDYKTTVILTSHDVSDIEKLCDRVIIINNGRIVFQDSMKNLKYNFLGKKQISLKTENDIDLNIQNINIVKRKDNAAKIDIDTKIVPIQNVINEILSKNNVMDISIDDPPLEEIISDIYKKTGAR